MNVGPELDKKIPRIDKNPLDYIKETVDDTIFLTPSNEKEISKIIKELRDCATGWDELPSYILKNSKYIIILP